MKNINVSRYANPNATGWAGYVEPDDRSWIVYVGLDGRPLAFLNRDPATGAVLPDDPEARAKHLEQLRTSEPTGTGNRIGEKHDGTAIYDDGPGPLELGEVVFPLGIDGGKKPG